MNKMLRPKAPNQFANHDYHHNVTNLQESTTIKEEFVQIKWKKHFIHCNIKMC